LYEEYLQEFLLDTVKVLCDDAAEVGYSLL